jgi:hypothetical protein
VTSFLKASAAHVHLGDQDDATGTEGPAGRQPEHPHRPDVVNPGARCGECSEGGTVPSSGGVHPPETQWNGERLQRTVTRFVLRSASI